MEQLLLRASESRLLEPWDHGCPVGGVAGELVYPFPRSLHMDCHSALSHCGNSLCLAASVQVQVYALHSAVLNYYGESALGGNHSFQGSVVRYLVTR